jgi:tetratricopeptide (TPR) repeat protein
MGRLTLKQMIINKCEEVRGLAGILAEIGDYSSGSALLKILKDEKKEFAKFYGLIKIVRHLFPDQEKELMEQYALTLDPNKQTARTMLEYLEVGKSHEIKRELISKMLDCKNHESQEFAQVYSIDDQYLSGSISYLEAINLYDKITIKKSQEMKVGIVLFKSYCYMDRQMHNMCYDLTLTLDELIDKLPECYIQETYYSRLTMFRVAYLVKSNQHDKARDYCNELINRINDSYFKSWAMMHLGNSYIVSDYRKAKFYLTSGYKLSKGKYNLAEENIKRSLNFVNTLWGEEAEHLNLKSTHPSDIHEVAFYQIKKNQFTEATKTLNKLNKEKMTDSQLAFHHYYRGLIDGKIESYTTSIEYFKKANDSYFRNLPILELQNLGINASILKALAI